jgi:hypothetical protein
MEVKYIYTTSFYPFIPQKSVWQIMVSAGVPSNYANATNPLS